MPQKILVKTLVHRFNNIQTRQRAVAGERLQAIITKDNGQWTVNKQSPVINAPVCWMYMLTPMGILIANE